MSFSSETSSSPAGSLKLSVKSELGSLPHPVMSVNAGSGMSAPLSNYNNPYSSRALPGLQVPPAAPSLFDPQRIPLISASAPARDASGGPDSLVSDSARSSRTEALVGSSPMGSGSGTNAAAGLPNQTPRLKVEDALSYLDQVKVQFQNRPQVYSDFLDIMKDFKSQAIDTPGVIQRVSSLFRGHPNLIVGFNTFLPPGYKIEVDGEHGERVSISTPTGSSHIITQGDKKPDGPSGTPPTQRPINTPIEFNHAINYVNKIKSRFQHKPQVYKQFLEILHSYQKEQRELKAGLLNTGQKPLTETQVYASVSKLFAEEADLLREFSQFLPDAMGPAFQSFQQTQMSPTTTSEPASPHTSPSAITDSAASTRKHSIKSEPNSSVSSTKKRRVEISYDTSFSEASKYGTLSEFQFFDKVRKAFRNDKVYENFLRVLVLFNLELITKSELIDLVQPFLGKHPELAKWLKDFLGFGDRTGMVESVPEKAEDGRGISSDLAMEIDYASCRRFGVSYRALPESYARPVCSGRDSLCDQVLNDTWVSFPSWSSEDSSFVSSKKSQYEEFIYRTEDERFELDIVIEVNRAAVQVLEAVQRRLSRGGASVSRLEETLGARSAPLMQRAIRRIYGDKAADIIDGLRRNPSVAVPLVLKRLKAKEQEWREAQKGFNKVWREQNEKFYLKSLDHQGLSFKQNDLKQIRSKALLNQIEILYDERHEKMEDGMTNAPTGPHMDIKYPNKTLFFYSVLDLLIHHVKRQSIQKEEKGRMKRLLKQTLPCMFGLEREELSDDEDSNEGGTSEEADCEGGGRTRLLRSCNSRSQDADAKTTAAAAVLRAEGRSPKTNCGYSVLLAPNPWYVFLRLHQLLSERLAKLHQHAEDLISANAGGLQHTKSAAETLRYEKKPPCAPERYYSTLIAQVKNLLDGQLDSGQYEDSLREIFTTQAYLAFTMDKLVQTMVRQLQQMSSDDLCVKCLHLHEKFKTAGGAGGAAYFSVPRQEMEEQYQSEAEQLMVDQNCFKICFLQAEEVVTLELLDTDQNEADEEARTTWSAYIQDYLDTMPGGEEGGPPQELLKRLSEKPVLIARNVRRRKRKAPEPMETQEDELVCKDALQVEVGPGGARLKYVAHTADFLCKRGARSKARQRAPESSRLKRQRFHKWHGMWLQNSVSDASIAQLLQPTSR